MYSEGGEDRIWVISRRPEPQAECVRSMELRYFAAPSAVARPTHVPSISAEIGGNYGSGRVGAGTHGGEVGGAAKGGVGGSAG